MRIEIAEHERMSESGSSLLRLIQNQDMPILDLFIRESIQNSLDAAKRNVSCVTVDFRTGLFEPTHLNKHLEKVGDVLNTRYPHEKKYEFIEIRDTNTSGLTGPTRYSDVKNNDFGNLLKLIYEICKPQQAEGSGGSWGLGKTIYFRLGIGLVIYYSRIEQNGTYQSRLAACLVEDETNVESIIPHNQNEVKRGIAWWGSFVDKERKHTAPIEDENEILDILSAFNLKPFTNDETGTSVIIPYVDGEKLLGETYAVNEDKYHKPYWTSTIEQYLNVAAQRWYAPRMENKVYPFGPYLSVSVNGNKILPERMLPLFRVIRELYMFTFANGDDIEGLVCVNEKNTNKEGIELRKVFSEGQTSGWLTHVKLNREMLGMLPPDNEKSPYQQICNKYIPMENGNSPIVMYTRRPGMIVGYDYNGSWTHNMPRCSENEFVIGLFSLNTNNTLKIPNTPQNETLLLEEYIRQGEKADHASWVDRIIKGRNLYIVQNIQKQIIRKISAKYSERSADATEKKNIGLGRALANVLLPSVGFGKEASIPSKMNNGGGGLSGSGFSGSRRRTFFRTIGSPSYALGTITYNFEMLLKKSVYTLELLVDTDSKKLSASIWESEDEIGTRFPLSFVDFAIKEYKNNIKHGSLTKCNYSMEDGKEENVDGVIAIKKINSKVFKVPSIIRVENAEEELILRGSLSFQYEDSSLKGVFDFKEGE